MNREFLQLDSSLLSTPLYLICGCLYVYAINKDIDNGDIVMFLVDFLVPPVGIARGIYLLLGG